MIGAIALHHSGVSRQSNPQQFDAINRYHKGKGYSISRLGYYTGYNFLIDGDGVITQTREIGEATGAQKGWNCIGGKCAISICFTGNFDQELPSDEQIESAKELLATLKGEYNVPVLGHRDLQDERTCPGVLMTEDYINRRLLGIVPPPSEAEKERQEELKKQLREAQSSLVQVLIKYVTLLINRLSTRV